VDTLIAAAMMVVCGAALVWSVRDQMVRAECFRGVMRGWADDAWRAADEWYEMSRVVFAQTASRELSAQCLQYAAENEAWAAEWFVKGCGG
jgi:hypothetical protein